MRTIQSLTTWFCSQLTRDELVEALAILLEVFDGSRDDIRLKSLFREEHPNYRRFEVDTTPPLTEAAAPVETEPARDWRELRSRHEHRTGKELAPVSRRANARPPPADCTCEHCGAPAPWLSVNDGVKFSQVRCKVCRGLSPMRRVRRESGATPYRCPHCNRALYEWKRDADRTLFKCSNDDCPHYLRNRQRLNEDEQQLSRTGMGSQFKTRYQWRRYHFDPAEVTTEAPWSPPRCLLNVRRNLEAVGLALAYSVSFGLSSRMTAQVLREVHGVAVSHQTVLNWMTAAAPLVWNTLERLKGRMRETLVAADETYIKVRGVWHYTWLVVGVESRAVWAWHVSDGRGEMPAIAVINRTLESRPEGVDGTLVLVGDGNPAYDAAVNAVNTDTDGVPLAGDGRKVERRTVVGLSNDDEESRRFRPFKQLVERLNRTYRYHTRSRSGHKSVNGAMALTTLFTAHYDFLRPHRALGGRPPVHLPELDGVDTLQGRWLKLLQLAA
jgi:transposase-like protein/ssDNA-binding Zn-finger/Zn-ribbon topoisomerase 1